MSESAATGPEREQPNTTPQKRPLESEDEVHQSTNIQDEGPRDKRPGRRKIRIEYIEDKSKRHITFSKRKAGIMKKAYELSTLTGTQVLLLVVSETGLVYTFTTPKLQPLVTKPEGKNLIQACLNAPDSEPLGNVMMYGEGAELEEREYLPEPYYPYDGDGQYLRFPAGLNIQQAFPWGPLLYRKKD